MKLSKLHREFYNRPTLQVAIELLGKILIYENDGQKLGGRLVEVEAYISENDPACHACRGKTPRNEIMYGDPGYLYVYFTYGNHHMLNIVTEKQGFPAAVLLRGMEPLYGINQMIKNRSAEKLTEIASGPGKMAQALGITTEQKGLDVTGSRFYIADDKSATGQIWQSPRIGLTDGKDKLWRFYFADSPHVSKMPVYARAAAAPIDFLKCDRQKNRK
jgi:DNA-3-methyladenine glycosylase